MNPHFFTAPFFVLQTERRSPPQPLVFHHFDLAFREGFRIEEGLLRISKVYDELAIRNIRDDALSIHRGDNGRAYADLDIVGIAAVRFLDRMDFHLRLRSRSLGCRHGISARLSLRRIFFRFLLLFRECSLQEL